MLTFVHGFDPIHILEFRILFVFKISLPSPFLFTRPAFCLGWLRARPHAVYSSSEPSISIYDFPITPQAAVSSSIMEEEADEEDDTGDMNVPTGPAASEVPTGSGATQSETPGAVGYLQSTKRRRIKLIGNACD